MNREDERMSQPKNLKGWEIETNGVTFRVVQYRWWWPFGFYSCLADADGVGPDWLQKTFPTRQEAEDARAKYLKSSELLKWVKV